MRARTAVPYVQSEQFITAFIRCNNVIQTNAPSPCFAVRLSLPVLSL